MPKIASEPLRNYLKKRVEQYWPDKRLVYRAKSMERATVLLVVLEELDRLKQKPLEGVSNQGQASV